LGYRPNRIPRSALRRGVISAITIAIVVAVGTIGVHLTEGLSYLDSFYFTSMLATGEGPSYAPATAAGKVFVAVMAFVSIGTVVTALVFVFGPFFGALFRSGIERVEKEAKKVEKEAEKLEG
jgi:hypothetical protein